MSKTMTLKHRLSNHHARVSRAIRYALGRMTLEDAYNFHHEVKYMTGIYPLTEMSTDDLLEQCESLWGHHPEFAEMARDACEHVCRKWDNSPEELDVAIDWAMSTIQRWAWERGIKLNGSWAEEDETEYQE